MNAGDAIPELKVTPDRYLTVSSATEDGRPPYTVLSVPAPS